MERVFNILSLKYRASMLYYSILCILAIKDMRIDLRCACNTTIGMMMSFLFVLSVTCGTL